MKKIFLFLFLIFCIESKAQFYIGAKFGCNYANQFRSNSVGYSSGLGVGVEVRNLGSGKLAPNFGFTGGYFLKRFFAFQTELAYMPMGYVDETYSNHVDINYVQWNPLMIRFLTGRREKVQFFVTTGFSLGFLTLAQYDKSSTYVQDPNDPFRLVSLGKIDIRDDVNILDGSLIGGIGLSIPVIEYGKLEIEVRYQGSFTNVYNFAAIHNSNLIFQLGYVMFLKTN